MNNKKQKKQLHLCAHSYISPIECEAVRSFDNININVEKKYIQEVIGKVIKSYEISEENKGRTNDNIT